MEWIEIRGCGSEQDGSHSSIFLVEGPGRVKCDGNRSGAKRDKYTHYVSILTQIFWGAILNNTVNPMIFI